MEIYKDEEIYEKNIISVKTRFKMIIVMIIETVDANFMHCT